MFEPDEIAAAKMEATAITQAHPASMSGLRLMLEGVRNFSVIFVCVCVPPYSLHKNVDRYRMLHLLF